MVVLNFFDAVPNVGNLTFVKIFAKTILTTMFSPISLALTILLTLGIIYMLSLMTYTMITKKFNKREQNKFVKNVFVNNKSVVVVVLLIGLFMNFSINKESIVKDTTVKVSQYDKVCTMITEQEMDQGLSDEQVMKDMDASGCNSKALPFIKSFDQMFGKKTTKPFAHPPRGEWFKRDTNEA
jgi:hypothetical protein